MLDPELCRQRKGRSKVQCDRHRRALQSRQPQLMRPISRAELFSSLTVKNIIPRDHKTQTRTDENIGGKMRAGGYARKRDGGGGGIGQIRNPAMLAITPREYRSYRKGHQGVAGREAGALAE